MENIEGILWKTNTWETLNPRLGRVCWLPSWFPDCSNLSPHSHQVLVRSPRSVCNVVWGPGSLVQAQAHFCCLFYLLHHPHMKPPQVPVPELVGGEVGQSWGGQLQGLTAEGHFCNPVLFSANAFCSGILPNWPGAPRWGTLSRWLRRDGPLLALVPNPPTPTLTHLLYFPPSSPGQSLTQPEQQILPSESHPSFPGRWPTCGDTAHWPSSTLSSPRARQGGLDGLLH
jgi:hypothetical protein